MMAGGSGDGWDGRRVDGVGSCVHRQEVRMRVDRRGLGGVDDGRGHGAESDGRRT